VQDTEQTDMEKAQAYPGRYGEHFYCGRFASSLGADFKEVSLNLGNSKIALASQDTEDLSTSVASDNCFRFYRKVPIYQVNS